MHNREAITLKLLWRSLCDFDLWPIYLIGLTNHIPFATPNIYLTLSLKDLGFSTFQTNLLVIPSQLLHGEIWLLYRRIKVANKALIVMNMIAITYLAEITNQLAFVAAIPQIWCLPFILWLRFVDTTVLSKWVVWFVMTLFLGNPYGECARVLRYFLSSRWYILTRISSSDPSRLGIPKLEYSPQSDRRCSHV
jgi:hypothetical protein